MKDFDHYTFDNDNYMRIIIKPLLFKFNRYKLFKII